MTETIHTVPADLMAVLASAEHERWAHWQRWVHAQCRRNEDGSLTIPAELVERWERQIRTAYADLSPQEQASDRHEVMRYWPHIVAHFGGGSNGTS